MGCPGGVPGQKVMSVRSEIPILTPVLTCKPGLSPGLIGNLLVPTTVNKLNSQPPLHTTRPGAKQASGLNLLFCIYIPSLVQRDFILPLSPLLSFFGSLFLYLDYYFSMFSMKGLIHNLNVHLIF